MVLAGIDRRYRMRVRERLSVLEYVAEHGDRSASRRFSLNRKTLTTWRDRTGQGGWKDSSRDIPNAARAARADLRELAAVAQSTTFARQPRDRERRARCHDRVRGTASVQRLREDRADAERVGEVFVDEDVDGAAGRRLPARPGTLDDLRIDRHSSRNALSTLS